MHSAKQARRFARAATHAYVTSREGAGEMRGSDGAGERRRTALPRMAFARCTGCCLMPVVLNKGAANSKPATAENSPADSEEQPMMDMASMHQRQSEIARRLAGTEKSRCAPPAQHAARRLRESVQDMVFIFQRQRVPDKMAAAR